MRLSLYTKFIALLASAALHAATPMVSQGGILRADGTAWLMGHFGDFPLQPTAVLTRFNGQIKLLTQDANYALLDNGDMWPLWGSEKVLDHVVHCASHGDTIVAVKDDGTVWAWGKNKYGQVGDGTRIERTTPTQVLGITTAIKAAANDGASAVLLKDGTVQAWGARLWGSIADGSPQGTILSTADANAVVLTPHKIANLDQVTDLSGANWTFGALRNDGSVWMWGGNWTGALGNGKQEWTSEPVKAALPKPAKALSVGWGFVLAVDRDGDVWGWGTSMVGNLGALARGVHLTPERIPGLSAAAGVAAGWSSSWILLANGLVMAMGQNDGGQLGTGDFNERINPDWVVNTSGTGYFNALDTSPAPSNQRPQPNVIVSQEQGEAPLTVTFQSNASDTDGSIASVVWKTSDGQTASGPEAAFTFKSVGTKQIWTIATDNQGMRSGAISTVKVNTSLAPTPAKPALIYNGSTVGLRTDGRLFAWGSGYNLGSGKTVDNDANPIPVDPSIGSAKALTAAGNTTLALLANGQLLSWGFNGAGILGSGTSEPWSYGFVPTNVVLPLAAKAIAGGNDQHALALLSDGNVWAWGNNDRGQLGTTTPTADQALPISVAGLPSINSIAANDGASFAVDAAGNVWAWGRNEDAELGQGNTDIYHQIVKVPALPPVEHLSCGGRSCIAFCKNGEIWGWGGWRNNFGTETNPYYNDYLTHTPIPLPHLAGLTEIQLGGSTKIAIFADGSAKVWGWNPSGQIPWAEGDVMTPLAIPNVHNAVSAAPISNGGALLMKDGSVLTWGLNNVDGQLGNGSLAPTSILLPVVDTSGTGLLDLIPEVPTDPANALLPYFLIANRSGTDLSATLSDLRANGLSGDIYFTALLPANSPLLPKTNGFTADSGMVPVSLGRGGVKQTGPGVQTPPASSGNLGGGNQFAVYTGATKDPLADSNAVICMGVTIPALSAKGQVLMRPLANGNKTAGVTQCPTVQTNATTPYTVTASGPINAHTIVAQIEANADDRNQVRNVYSWAVAPNGQQFMQIGPNNWALMRDPMLPAMTLNVPADGKVTLPVTAGLDLSGIAGTLVYVGLGSSWDEVKLLNKAGHYYTVQ